MSLDWNPKEPTKGDASMEGFFIRRVIALSVIIIAGIICSLYALYLLATAASTNPPVVVYTEDGRAYYVTPEPSALNTKALERHVQDMMFVLFTRTEKSYTERLEDYCSPSMIDKVEVYYEGISKRYPSGYYQTGKVMDAKLNESNASKLNIDFEILIESRSDEETTQNTFYVKTQFIHVGSSEKNPIGWNLHRIQKMDKNQYFEQELKDELNRKTSINK